MQISKISILNFSECVNVLDSTLNDRPASVLFLLHVMQKVEELTGKQASCNWGIANFDGSIAAYPVGRTGCLAMVRNFSVCLDEHQLGYGASLIVLHELSSITHCEKYKELKNQLLHYLLNDCEYNDGALCLYRLSLI
ncbi:hypothetical protein NL493_25560 [Klebsiella pneumoniae]|nr:hypothetical protein [Klebsiella pneumoniae]